MIRFIPYHIFLHFSLPKRSEKEKNALYGIKKGINCKKYRCSLEGFSSFQRLHER